jgi:uncharacterized membrane protein YGL010W
MSAADARPIHGLLGQYAADHQHPVNQRIHAVCVPVILWTVVALVWPVPMPGLGWPGVWAGLVMALVLAWYARLSAVLALAMVGVFAVCAALTHALLLAVGPTGTWLTAAAAFALAWVAQFVGHGIEGKRPSFLTDLKYLLVGPLWVVAKALKSAGIPF